MRTGFFASGDPESSRTWSGVPPYMLRSLQAELGDVMPIAPLSENALRLFSLLAKFDRYMLGQMHPAHLNPLLVRLSRARLRARIAAMKPKVVIGAAASTLIGGVPPDIPAIYCSDGTFRLLSGYYDKMASLPEAVIRRADAFEREAIGRADALVYSSEWAAESALKDYDADPAKITVLPFGANLHSSPPVQPKRLSTDRLSLFFMGGEWRRKGADVAVAVAAALRQRGMETNLTIVGCAPPPGETVPEWVDIVPYLSKAVPQQLARMEQLFREADFFILPSRAECTAIVLGEAAAYGLPAIVSDTGGMPAVVVEGETGSLLPEGSGGGAYAERILQLTANPAHYGQMRAASRARFEQVLNWGAWAAGVGAIARRLAESAAQPGSYQCSRSGYPAVGSL